MGNRFNIRIEGTRIKHTMGPVSLKLYDKFGLIVSAGLKQQHFRRFSRRSDHRD